MDAGDDEYGIYSVERTLEWIRKRINIEGSQVCEWMTHFLRETAIRDFTVQTQHRGGNRLCRGPE